MKQIEKTDAYQEWFKALSGEGNPGFACILKARLQPMYKRFDSSGREFFSEFKLRDVA